MITIETTSGYYISVVKGTEKEFSFVCPNCQTTNFRYIEKNKKKFPEVGELNGVEFKLICRCGAKIHIVGDTEKVHIS